MHKLLPRHVGIIEMIDEELVNGIVAEFGKLDPELLERKLNAMRILENVELPSSIADLFIKTKDVSTLDASEANEVSHEDDDIVGEKEKEVDLEAVIIPPKFRDLVRQFLKNKQKMVLEYTLCT